MRKTVPNLVQQIVNHPTIQVATLQQGLAVIDHITRKNPLNSTLNIIRCKQIITKKLNQMLR